MESNNKMFYLYDTRILLWHTFSVWSLQSSPNPGRVFVCLFLCFKQESIQIFRVHGENCSGYWSRDICTNSKSCSDAFAVTDSCLVYRQFYRGHHWKGLKFQHEGQSLAVSSFLSKSTQYSYSSVTLSLVHFLFYLQNPWPVFVIVI